MADLIGDYSQPESNNFDNDFEKLDPFSPESANAVGPGPGGDGDQFVSSSSAINNQDKAEEDLYPESSPSEAEPALVDFGEPTLIPSQPALIPDIAPSEPEPVLVSSTIEETPEPEPVVLPTPTPSAPAPVTPTEPISKYTVDKPVESSTTTPSGNWIAGVDPREGQGLSPAFQTVIDLVYWRDVKKTGVVFGSVLVVLFSLALFSVLSVAAYLSLAALTVTVSFRIYKNVLGAVQKTGEGHPFKEYLDVDIALPEEKVHQLADVVMAHVSCALKELRRVFLVEDLVDSIKFGLLLWVLTYVGAWFNGMTLIILTIVGIFTLPKVYETYKVQIDQYMDLARTQIRNAIKQVQEKIPLPGKKKSA